jgi:hypothetical protein
LRHAAGIANGERIGAGGMAEVFRSTMLAAEGFERPVAIKRILPGLSEDEAFARMFVNEARISARLQHPNVVQVLDFDRDDSGRLFLVMELVEGRSLDEVMRRNHVGVSIAAYVAAELLQGLAHVHEISDADGRPLRLVHRDVSPHNVLVSWDGAVKISDFGVAKAMGVAAGSRSVAIKGKPRYMAPEQVTHPDDVDQRADLFAVGATLYEMLTERRLYQGTTTEEILGDVVQVARGWRQLLPVERAAADVPPAMCAFVGRLLAVNRDSRPATAREALAELHASGVVPADGAQLLGDAARATSHGAEPAAASDTSVRRAMDAATRTAKGALEIRDGTTPRHPLRRIVAAAGVLGGVMTGGMLLMWAKRSSVHDDHDKPSAHAELPAQTAPPTDRQLTSPGSPHAKDAGFSPKGQLAVLHDERIQIFDRGTGEPHELATVPGHPYRFSWLDDGRLLVASAADLESTSFDWYVLPIDGGPARALGLNGLAVFGSAGGTRLTVKNPRGILIRDIDGTREQLVIPNLDKARLTLWGWSPDDKWFLYGRGYDGGDPQLHVVASDGTSDAVLPTPGRLGGARNMPWLQYAGWLSDDRIAYESWTETNDLVAVSFDASSMRVGTKSVLTRLPTEASLVALSSDGRRLVYTIMETMDSEYHVSLAKAPYQAFSESHQDWDFLGTTPSATIYRSSDVPGRSQLVAVGANGSARTIVSIEGHILTPFVTPDGLSVLYLRDGERAGTITVERVPVEGGAPAVISKLPATDWTAKLACARVPSGKCVLGMQDTSGETFFELDPYRGIGRKIATLPSRFETHFDVSPDGAEIIAVHNASDVQVIDIGSGATKVVLNKLGELYNDVVWQGNNRSFVLYSMHAASAELYFVRAANTGAPESLWQSTTVGPSVLRMSDDGQTLHFHGRSASDNLWLRELPASTFALTTAPQ